MIKTRVLVLPKAKVAGWMREYGYAGEFTEATEEQTAELFDSKFYLDQGQSSEGLVRVYPWVCFRSGSKVLQFKDDSGPAIGLRGGPVTWPLTAKVAAMSEFKPYFQGLAGGLPLTQVGVFDHGDRLDVVYAVPIPEADEVQMRTDFASSTSAQWLDTKDGVIIGDPDEPTKSLLDRSESIFRQR